VRREPKNYTAEEKVAILRRHLVEKEPISKLCDELGLQPTVFYRWQKDFFENGAVAFQAKARANHQAEQERIGMERLRKTAPAEAAGRTIDGGHGVKSEIMVHLRASFHHAIPRI
jgi:transposase-like protein